MAYSHYERLTATDALFLELESPSIHMHVGAVGLFEAGPLRSDRRGLDIDRIHDFVESALAQSPRFRQRLASQPVTGRPVWVDDRRFRLSYHLRHTSLPKPGDLRQLKRLAGRIMSQKLDRGKPLWEMWVIEGLEHDRFALLVKAHHCMVDGIAGIDLLTSVLRLDPDPTVPESQSWIPRPLPSTPRLLVDEVRRRAFLPLRVMGAGGQLLRDPRGALEGLSEGARSVAEVIWAGLAPTTSTPLNPTIGPYRRFDWTCFDLSDVKDVKAALGGTLNDVVLAVTAGAVRRFLHQRGEPTQDVVFRAMVPVSIRRASERGQPGNRVVNFLCPLPVDQDDPARRLQRIVETTDALKRSRLPRGGELLEEIGDVTFQVVLTGFIRLAARQHAFNLVVTNVPGPQVPAYLLGSPMAQIFPLVPLFDNQALGIALFSYHGQLCWGFNADWEALPDLHEFVRGVEIEFERLRKAAAEAPRRPARRSGSRRRKRTPEPTRAR